MANTKLGNLLLRYSLGIIMTVSALSACGSGSSTIKQAAPPRSAVDVSMTPPSGQNDPYINENITAMKQPQAADQPQSPEYQPVSDDVSPAKSRLINIQARNTALGDILHVIADAASMNLIINDGVQQDRAVTITLKRVTADEALTTILASADYFYTIKDNILTVEATGTKIFELGHPAMIQGYTVDVGGDILSSGASLSAGGGGGSSNIKGTISQTIKNDSKAFDFWESLEKALQSMIGKRESSAAPAATPSQPAKIETITKTAGGITTSQSKTIIERQQEPPIIRQPEQSAPSDSREPHQAVIVNRMTGTIMVTATRKNLAAIENYLDVLRKTLNRQVLIEARIIEVQLNDQLKFGIDWSFLSNMRTIGQLSGGYGAVVGTLSSALDNAAPAFRLGAQTTNKSGPITGVLTALKSQGEVKTLSNPRINVMNGQTALLTVGRNQNYISNVTTTATAGSPPIITFTVTTSNVLSGMMIGLAPIINGKGEISMTVTPIISDLVNLEEKSIGIAGDPTNQMTISIPTVDLRELSTTVKIRNGEMIIIGGLIANKKDLSDNKVPLIGDIPWLGTLFTKIDHTDKRTELVVLLQPYLISNE